MNPRLQGYSAAVFGLQGDDRSAAQALADDLGTISREVEANAPLRAAITDTAVPAVSRRAILADLLANKVSPAAQRLASFAAGAVSAPEVPQALSWLAHQAGQQAEGVLEDEPRLSFMAARTRVGGFAAALFEDLETDELETVEDDLFRFARIVASSPGLRGALSDRDLPVAARQAIAHQLLEGKVDAASMRLVDYVLAGGRPRDVIGTLDWLVEETARVRGWRVARVRAAAEVQEVQRAELSQSLSALAGAPVELQVIIDPSLLSGAIIQVGDLQVDATARGRLDHLREHLLISEWQESGFGGANR
jgi:F-type H+-transporting ATPase subunit delta